MPGRNFNSPNYRYGFNGQEKDDEVYGSGNLNTAEFWGYDTRLGRRWNMDPIVKFWESPYATFRNNPIYFNDPNGLDGKKPKGKPKCADCGSNQDITLNPGKKADKSYKPVEQPFFIPSIPINYPSNQEIPEPGLDNLTLKTPNTNGNNQGMKPTFIEMMADKLRRMDNFFDHTNMEYSRPPVQTSFWGFMSFGAGGSKNVHMVSPHATNWADGNPGSLIYSLGKTSVSFNNYTGLSVQATEFFGKYADGIGALQYFIDGSGFDPFSPDDPVLSKPKIRVIQDSQIFWHIETSATGIEYLVETWQAKGDSGKAENNRKEYRSVHKKTRRD